MISLMTVFPEAGTTDIEYLDDESSFVTVIEDEPGSGMNFFNKRKTITKNKTTYYRDARGKTVWYVKVTGTFTYGGGRAVCTDARVEAESMNSIWRILDRSSSRSGNSASATAIGGRYTNGTHVQKHRKTVTLRCSTTGVFS